MFKLDQVNQLKKKIIENPKEPEVISEEYYRRSKANIDTMCILNKEDAFLYFASLNLLNTYVKQDNKSKISYNFKSCVTSAFDSIIMNKIDANYCYDNIEKLLIVNIDGMQFSFHNVTPSPKMIFAKQFPRLVGKEYFKQQEWEGIRLQPVAQSLFKFANNLEGLSNESIAGNLKEYQNECVQMQMEK